MWVIRTFIQNPARPDNVFSLKVSSYFRNLLTVIVLLASTTVVDASEERAEEQSYYPIECCLPTKSEEAPVLEAKVHLDPYGGGGLLSDYPQPPKQQPVKKSDRLWDKNAPAWSEGRDANYENRWTLKDTAFQMQYTLLHVIDWGQTRYIADSKEFYETNVILGPEPTKEAVDLYFATTLITQSVISYKLPRKWRRGFQIFWIAVESLATAGNSMAGIAVSF